MPPAFLRSRTNFKTPLHKIGSPSFAAEIEVIRCEEEDPRKFRESRPQTPNRFRIPIGPMESAAAK